jgi:hypothetical protein
MPRVGFEITTPVFERMKTVHALRCPYTYEFGSARVPMSQTCLCVGRKVGSPLMRVWWNISEPGAPVKLAEPDSYVYGPLWLRGHCDRRCPRNKYRKLKGEYYGPPIVCIYLWDSLHREVARKIVTTTKGEVFHVSSKKILMYPRRRPTFRTIQFPTCRETVNVSLKRATFIRIGPELAPFPNPFL